MAHDVIMVCCHLVPPFRSWLPIEGREAGECNISLVEKKGPPTCCGFPSDAPYESSHVQVNRRDRLVQVRFMLVSPAVFDISTIVCFGFAGQPLQFLLLLLKSSIPASSPKRNRDGLVFGVDRGSFWTLPNVDAGQPAISLPRSS
ncbi:hypothetical protein RvY_09737 [Ramazzottius varieornatus]|uniref:Uncharacterized protein n=1 Tax=Ramazzottius varieornatus TaxID=947166 RepID=A0A1D1VI77_RAMVA|nr:hypothetical protein RvY_09737 [Ramazzottius varieornatus]